MKVQVKNRSYILSQNDFLESGGEGHIYYKNNLIFKIYNNPSKVIAAGKINELSVLSLGNIIKPLDLVFKTKPIGYTMIYIDESEALCKLFTKSYKIRKNISPDMIMNLVRIMQNTVKHIHKNNILIVDLNEMNFLTNAKYDNVYFIDVDSYQTPGYPATALMESIRDRHSTPNQFNQGTDWFAFAIVSFQLLIGIHPYKGRHPKYNNIDQRMENNISVFNGNVTVPKICFPINSIPNIYRDWYKSIFEDGLRDIPPDDTSNMITILPTKIVTKSSTGRLDITIIYECKFPIINYVNYNDNEVFIGHKHILYNRKTKIKSTVENIIFYKGNPIEINISGGNLYLSNGMTRSEIDMILTSPEHMVYDNRLYIKEKDMIYEVQFTGSTYSIKAIPKMVGYVMEKATKLYPGMIIQNMLGSYYISIFPQSGECHQLRVNSLDDYKIIDAKYDKGLLVIYGVKDGEYYRFSYMITYNDKTSLSLIHKTNTNYESINTIILDKGLCVNINNNDELNLFNILPSSNHKITTLKDKVIHGGMQLFTDGSRVLFIENKKLCQLRMI